MKYAIKTFGVFAALGVTPAFADANESFIEITAKIHQMMTDVVLADQYCPKIKGDLGAMKREILRIGGNGAADMIKQFGQTVQGRLYLQDQTTRFKGLGRDLACEWALLYWGPKGSEAKNLLVDR